MSVRGHAHPELQMRLDVDAGLVNASDGEVLYTHAFRALGDARKFSAWLPTTAVVFAMLSSRPAKTWRPDR